MSICLNNFSNITSDSGADNESRELPFEVSTTSANALVQLDTLILHINTSAFAFWRLLAEKWVLGNANIDHSFSFLFFFFFSENRIRKISKGIPANPWLCRVYKAYKCSAEFAYTRKIFKHERCEYTRRRGRYTNNVVDDRCAYEADNVVMTKIFRPNFGRREPHYIIYLVTGVECVQRVMTSEKLYKPYDKSTGKSIESNNITM